MPVMGFARGYTSEFGGGAACPTWNTGAAIGMADGGSYGRQFKKDVRRYYGSFCPLQRSWRD